MRTSRARPFFYPGFNPVEDVNLLRFPLTSRAVAAAVLLLGSSASHATIVIEDGLGTKPSLAFQTYGNWAGNSTTRSGEKDGRDNTQSFILGSTFQLDKVVMNVNDALAGSSVTFRLFEVPGSTTGSTLTLGSELASEAYTFTADDQTLTTNSADPLTEDNLLTWDLPDLTLDPGGYALQIDGPESGPAGGVYVGWRSSGSNAYADGKRYRHLAPEPTTLVDAGGLVDAAFGLQAVDDNPWTRHTIQAGGAAFNGADGVRGMDVDGDGDLDLVSGAEESGVTRFYLNPGSANATGVWGQTTTGSTPDVEDALLIDLDNDGVNDVISSREGASQKLTVQWAPSDGDYLGGTWSQSDVSVAPSTQWMFAEAFGDSVVVGGKNSSELGVLTPDGTRNVANWTYEKIADMGWTMSIIARDMDGDDDLDILVSDRRNGGTQRGAHWLENGNAWQSHAIGVSNHDVMLLAIGDLNGDGHDDIVAPSYDASNDDHLFVHFGDGSGTAWSTVEITWPTSFGQAKAAAIADMNNDGQMDIVLTAGQADGVSGVVWLEYLTAPTDTGWLRHEISGLEGSKFDLAQLVDLDGDGDLDVVTTDEGEGAGTDGLGLFWYANPLDLDPGDANADRAVDLDDLEILATHWNQAVTGWHQADFNGDGVVDALDLDLLRLNWDGTSGFNAAAASVTFVPEPSSLALATLAGCGLCLRRRRAAV